MKLQMFWHCVNKKNQKIWEKFENFLVWPVFWVKAAISVSGLVNLVL